MRERPLTSRRLVTGVAAALGLLALAVALWSGHPWEHAALIGLGAGCVAFALGTWWGSRPAGEGPKTKR